MSNQPIDIDNAPRPLDSAGAREALARAESLESTARRTASHMPRYYSTWAGLNVLYGVALWLWASTFPKGGGHPNVFWIIPITLVFLAALAWLIVWYYRQARGTRPRNGASTTFSIIANAVGWPLGMVLVNAWAMNSDHPLMRGIGFLVGAALSAALLLGAAAFARRESR